jgi:hypothetical protein
MQALHCGLDLIAHATKEMYLRSSVFGEQVPLPGNVGFKTI